MRVCWCPVVLVNDVRALCQRLLDAYESAGGIGPDAYAAAPCWHAMAEAKYVLALTALVRTQLVSESNARVRLRAALERLRRGRVPSPGGKGDAWGLGFVWRERSAEEAYLITTALVLHALDEMAGAAWAPDGAAELRAAALEGLVDWLAQHHAPPGQEGIAIPFYSSTLLLLPVYNAAAYACASVLTAETTPERPGAAPDRRDARALLVHIERARIPGVGWPYSADDGTVDLIHQCYIAGALHRSGASVTDYAHDLLAHFTALGDYVDVFRWVVDVGAARASGKLVRRLEHERGLELLHKPARLWSLGELLALLASLTRTAEPGRALSGAANGLAESLLARSDSGDTAWTFPRQTMHAAHGLAEYLRTKRWPHAAS